MASIRFVPLSVAAMNALLAGDLAAASADAGTALSDHFVSTEAQHLWHRRVDQIASDPSAARWVASAVICSETGYAVGYAGFHGPPDEDGMVEIGYTVVPERRRLGYATATVAGLLERAAGEPGVQVVRATISPDNVASQATIAKYGFVHNGEQWDEEDGLELIFEVPVLSV
jgi:[ribosomal protein S5]-alanine N-acetyltransferase